MPRSRSPKRRSKSYKRSRSPSRSRKRSRSPSKKRKRSKRRSTKRVERILYISFCAKNDNIENLRKLESKLLKRSGITLDGHDYGKDGACVFLNVKNKGYNIFAVNNASRKYKVKMHISNE